MTRKLLIFICLICFVALTGGAVTVLFIQSHKKVNDVMQFAVYPSSTLRETYYFTLDQKGVLKCTVGERKNDDITQNNFLKTTVKSSKKTLSESDLQLLTSLLNELEDSDYALEKSIVDDGWDVVLLYNGITYEMNLEFDNESQVFINLVNKIIELSPITVDLHSWA